MAEVRFRGKLSSRRTAAVCMVIVAAFMVLYMGAMHLLSSANPHVSSARQGEETVFATEPYYVLLIGSDSRRGTALYTGKSNQHAQTEAHSDIMTLVRVDPVTYKITLVTVPRDTKLDSSDEKINETLAQEGPELTVKAVEELCGVSIPYYVMTTFSGFVQLVNGLGGVVVDVPMEVTVPDAMTGRDLTVDAGQNKDLDGSEALVLARARKEYSGFQDNFRQQNVRELEKSIIEKVLSYGAQAVVVSSGGAFAEEEASEGADGTWASVDVGWQDALGEGEAAGASQVQTSVVEYVLSPQLADAFDELRACTTTNMSSDFLMSNIVNFVTHADQVVIYSTTGPYEGDYDENDQWIVLQDKEAWAALMARVDAGEDPNRRYVEQQEGELL